MPEIILITLAKNLFHILKNEVGNQKRSQRGGVHPPINPSPINDSSMEQKFTEPSQPLKISVIFMTQNIFNPGKKARDRNQIKRWQEKIILIVLCIF